MARGDEMSTGDRILNFTCRTFSVIFGVLASLSMVACVFGVSLAASDYRPYETIQQVRALGLVAIVSFIACVAFAALGDMQ